MHLVATKFAAMGNGESTHRNPILDDNILDDKRLIFLKSIQENSFAVIAGRNQKATVTHRRNGNTDFHSNATHRQNSQSASEFRSTTKSFDHRATNQNRVKSSSWFSSLFSAASGNKMKYANCKECRAGFEMNVEECFEKCKSK